jgi:PAS domain S-box-containing protein
VADAAVIPAFLRHGGETGRLIAAHDWSATPLGSIANWPQSLRTATALLLRSPVPIVMLWGPDGIMLYNDAYSRLAGARHPQLLGSKVREGWPEVADFNDHVMRVGLAGGTLAYRDQELVLHRHGRPERVWMNLDYSPVVDESGEPAGVIAIVVETTGRVLAERRSAFLSQVSERLRSLRDPRAVLATSTALLGTHLGVDRVGYGEIEGEGEALQVVVADEWNREGSASIAGRHRLGDYAGSFRAAFETGRPIVFADIAADPRSAGSEGTAHAAIGVGAQIVLPLIKDGRLVGLFFVHQAVPRNWSDDEVELVREVAKRTWSALARARAEQALREREEQLSAFISQTTAGFAQVDLDGRFTMVNQRFCEIVGRGEDELMTLRMQDITHPDDLPRNLPLFERAVRDGTPYAHEKRYVRPDGSIVWVNNSVAVIRRSSGEPFGVLAVTLDVTTRRRAAEALRKSEESLRLAVEGAGMATWDVDLASRRGHWSGTRFDILGYARPADLTGSVEDWLRLIHPQDRAGVEEAVERCFGAGIPFTVEYRILRADNGEERWLHSYGNRITVDSDEPPRFIGVSFDITARKRSEQHQMLLIHELNHRVKNTLAIVQAIAHQSFKGETLSAEARRAFEGRLAALSAAHNLLTRQNWEGASIRQVVDEGMAAYRASDRIVVSGPDLPLAPKAAVSLAMAVHELATNAVKYGALSTERGQIHIDWAVEDGGLRWTWRESGGPPVTRPARRGFGSRMIERGLASELRGEVRLEFPIEGLVCRLSSPLPAAERDE